MRRIVMLSSVAALAMLCVGLAAGAAAQPVPPFSLTVEVKIDTIVDGKAIKTVTSTVTNDTAKEITVTLVTNAEGKDPLSRTLAVMPGAPEKTSETYTDLAPGAALSVTASLAGGVLEGFEDGYTLEKSATGQATPEPIAAKWSATSYWPWPSADDGLEVPLEGTKTCDHFATVPDTVGWLTAGPNAVKVTAECEDEDGRALIELTVEDLGGPLAAGREYKGTVDLAPGDDDAGAIELTVVRNHAIWMPLIFLLLLGWFAWFLVTKKEGSGRVVLAATERLYKLEADAAEHDRQGTRYDLAPLIRRTATKIIADLGKLAADYPKASELEAQDEYKKSIVDERIDPLATLVSAWGPSGLGGVGGGHLARAVAWNAGSTDIRRFMRRVVSFIEGLETQSQEIDDTATAAECVAEIAAAAKLAGIGSDGSEPTVPARLKAAADLYEKIDVDPSHDALGDDTFKSARTDAMTAWNLAAQELRAAQPLAVVALLNTGGAVASAELKLVAAAKRLDELTRSPRFASAGVEPSGGESKEIALDEPPTATELAARARNERRGFDLLVLVVVAAGVILTGLTTNYVGKTFGTPWDYAQLAVWGLAGGALAKGVDEALWRYRASAKSILG